jgi:hypothetical protein
MFLLKVNLKKFIVPIVIVFCSVISSSNIVFAQDNLVASNNKQPLKNSKVYNEKLENSQNSSTNGTESNGIGKETLNRLNFFTYLYFEKIPNLAKTDFFFMDDNFCKITDQTLIDQYKLIKGEFIGKIKRTGLNGPVENFDASVLPVGSSIYTVTTAPDAKQYDGIDTLCMVEVGKELILYCICIEG